MPAVTPAPEQLAVAYRPGIDVDWTFRYLDSRAIAGIESVDDGIYRRDWITSLGQPVDLEILRPVQADDDPPRSELVLRVGFDGAGELTDVDREQLIARCRHLFSLDEDDPPMDSGIGQDPVLGRLLRERPGLRLPGAWDRFECAIRIIVGQQVTVAAASTLAGRLVERAGSITAEALADQDLTGLGMPDARARTISAFAEAVVTDEVDLEHDGTLDAAVAELTSVKGIGPWTAQLIAARVLRLPDAFPPKDLGLRRSYERLGGVEPVEVAAERWHPYRAVAIAHLWAAE